MKITSKITMDLAKENQSVCLYALREDRYSREIQINLTADGVDWEIPAEVSAVIRYCKADGTGGVYDALPDGTGAWQAEGNVLTIQLAPQLFTCTGVVRLTVSLIRNEQQLTTFPVFVQVLDLEEGENGSADYVNVTGFLPGVAAALPGQLLRVRTVRENGGVVQLEAVTLGELAVLLEAQELTEQQKTQGRENLGAASVEEVLAALEVWEGGSY